jgi:hypothetical protein
MTDIIDITDLDITESSFGNSSNFGGGLELLMNDKIKDIGKQTSEIELDDLNNLENELNNLVEDTPTTSYKPRSDLFSSPSSFFEEKQGVRFSNDDENIGESTSKSSSNNKTWDGFGKFNDIPMNPDKDISMEPKLSKDEMLREKFKYLRKLEALEKKGVELSKKYNMDSPLQEMQGEYETIMDEKTKQNSVKFQGNMLMAVINGLEFLNSKFDPFDIHLDGWSSQIEENLNDYDEIFSELHEKYKSKASMGPELKLLFQLGGSGMMVHMSNTMFKSSMPGMDDILRQNPDLMRSFQNAAVNSMSQSSPGFGGFMSNFTNPEPQVSQGRGPPAPMATQGPNAIQPPMGRSGNNSYARPDLNFSKSNFVDDGISLRENFERPDVQDRTTKRTTPRPEMKGPSDISDILSGLKTKTINIQEPHVENTNMNDSSTISINDLKEMQTQGNMPKRSGRRNNKKSASNTISLDI